MNFRDAATRGKSPRSLLSPIPVRNTTPVPPGRPLPGQKLSAPPSPAHPTPRTAERAPKTLKSSQKADAAKPLVNRNAMKTKPDVAGPIKVDMATVLRSRQKNMKSPPASAGTSASNVPFSNKPDAEEKKMSIKSLPQTKTSDRPFFLVRREASIAPTAASKAPASTIMLSTMVEKDTSPLTSPDISPNVSTVGSPRPTTSTVSHPGSAATTKDSSKGKKTKPRATEGVVSRDNSPGSGGSRSHEEVGKRSTPDRSGSQTMSVPTGSPSGPPAPDSRSRSNKVVKMLTEPPDKESGIVNVGPNRRMAKKDGPSRFRDAARETSKELFDTSSIKIGANQRFSFSETSSTSSTDCVLSSTEQLKSLEDRKLKLPEKWTLHDSPHHSKHRVRKPRSPDEDDNQMVYFELKKRFADQSREDLDEEYFRQQLEDLDQDDDMEVAISFPKTKSVSDSIQTTDFSDHLFPSGVENFSFPQLELGSESNELRAIGNLRNESLNPALIDTVFKEQTHQLQQQLEEQRQLRLQLEKQQHIQMRLHKQQQELQRQLLQMQQSSSANIRLEGVKEPFPSVMQTIKSMFSSQSSTSQKSSSEKLKSPELEKSGSVIQIPRKKFERLLTTEERSSLASSSSSVFSGIKADMKSKHDGDPKSGAIGSHNLKSKNYEYIHKGSSDEVTTVYAGHTDESSARSKEAMSIDKRRIRKHANGPQDKGRDGKLRADNTIESTDSYICDESITNEDIDNLSESTSKSGEWQREFNDKKLKNVKESDKTRLSLLKTAQGLATRGRELVKSKVDTHNKSDRMSSKTVGKSPGTPGTSRNVATKSLSPVKKNRVNDVERNKSISPMYRISVLDMVSKKVRAKAKDNVDDQENVTVEDENVRENLQNRIIITTEDGVTPTTRSVTLVNFPDELDDKPTVSGRQSRSRLKRVVPGGEKTRLHEHYSDQTRSKMKNEQHVKKETIAPKTQDKASGETPKPSALKGLFHKIDRVVADLESYMEIDPHTTYAEKAAARPEQSSPSKSKSKSKIKDRERNFVVRKVSPPGRARMVMHDDTEAPITSGGAQHQFHKPRKQENFDDKSMTDAEERKKKKHVTQVTARRKTKDDESIPYEDILRKSVEKSKKIPKKESVMPQTESHKTGASDIPYASKHIAKESTKHQPAANEGDGQKHVKQAAKKVDQPSRKEVAAKPKQTEAPKVQHKRVENAKVENDSKANKHQAKSLKEGIGDGEAKRYKKEQPNVPRPEVELRGPVERGKSKEPETTDREVQRPGVSGEKKADRYVPRVASEMEGVSCMGDANQSLKSLTSLSTASASTLSVQSNKTLENVSLSDKSAEQVVITLTESELSSNSSQFALAIMNAPAPPMPQSNIVRSVCNLSSSFKRFITSQRSQVSVPRLSEALTSHEQNNQDAEFAVAVVTKKSNWMNQNVVVQSLDKLSSSFRRLVGSEKKPESQQHTLQQPTSQQSTSQQSTSQQSTSQQLTSQQPTLQQPTSQQPTSQPTLQQPTSQQPTLQHSTEETEEEKLRKLKLRDSRKQKMQNFKKRLSEKIHKVDAGNETGNTTDKAVSAEMMLTSQAVNPILQESLGPNISMEPETLLTVLRSPQVSITLVTSDSSSGDGVVDTSTELVKMKLSKSSEKKILANRMSTVSVVKENTENESENSQNETNAAPMPPQPSHFAIAFVMNDNKDKTETKKENEKENEVVISSTFVFQQEKIETEPLMTQASIDKIIAEQQNNYGPFSFSTNDSFSDVDQPFFGAPAPQPCSSPVSQPSSGASTPQPSYGALAPATPQPSHTILSKPVCGASSTHSNRSSISQQTDEIYSFQSFGNVCSVQTPPFVTLTPTHFGLNEPSRRTSERGVDSLRLQRTKLESLDETAIVQSAMSSKDSEQFFSASGQTSDEGQVANNPNPDNATSSITVLKFDQSLSAKAGSILSAVLGAAGKDSTDESPSTSSGLRHEPSLTDEYTITVMVMEPIGAKTKRKRPAEQAIDRTLDKLLSSVKAMVSKRKAQNADRIEAVDEEDDSNHVEDSVFSVAMILMDPGRSQVTPENSCVAVDEEARSPPNARGIDMSKITSWSQVKELNSTEFSEVIQDVDRDAEDSISDHKVSDLLDVEMMTSELKEHKKKGDRSK